CPPPSGPPPVPDGSGWSWAYCCSSAWRLLESVGSCDIPAIWLAMPGIVPVAPATGLSMMEPRSGDWPLSAPISPLKVPGATNGFEARELCRLLTCEPRAPLTPPVTPLAAPVTPLTAPVTPLTAPVTPLTAPVTPLTAPLTAPVTPPTAPVTPLTAPLTAPVTLLTAPLTAPVTPLTAPLTAPVTLLVRELTMVGRFGMLASVDMLKPAGKLGMFGNWGMEPIAPVGKPTPQLRDRK